MDRGQQPTLKSPSDEELLAALRALRQQDPGLGRAKGLRRLKEENGWTLSNRRLKGVMAKHSLGSRAAPDTSEPIQYLKDALAAQQKYKDESTRCFKLYSRGPYNFGVTPNADQGKKSKLVMLGRPVTGEIKCFMASTWPMQLMWEFYWATAQKAGIAKEDVGRQLEAEYGVNPIPYLPPPPTEAEIEARKANFKRQSLVLKRELLKSPEARPYVPVDKDVEPIWDESTNGEFTLIVVKIDKGSGLTEYGTV